ncbi:MAG: ATP synthase subunit I [Lachnospiraceae bacterium]|nr:ATP synthase subunit I [Lachnospiraceae bacterium]
MTVQIILLIFFDRPGYRSTGLWMGAITAVVMAWHMERTIVRSFGCDEKGAIAVMRTGAMIRFFIMTALMALTAYFGFADPLCFFAGLLCLKLSAYAEPFTAKITARVCAGIDGAEGTAEDVKDAKEQDAFGYTPEERAALDEQVSRMSEKYRAEIAKMREDFKGFK